jgi:hypothetical protein
MVPGHETIREQWIGIQGGIPTILLTWFLDMKQLETSGLESKEVFYTNNTILFKWFLDMRQLENSGFDSMGNFQGFYSSCHFLV